MLGWALLICGAVVIILGHSWLNAWSFLVLIGICALGFGIALNSILHFFWIIWRRLPKPSTRLTLLLLAGSVIAVACYYRFCTAEGMLAHYGVHFNPNSVGYESYALNTARFWFDGPGGRLNGPEVTGDLLVVEPPHRTQAGQVEFSVRTAVGKDNNRVWIRLISPPRGQQAFQVLVPEHTRLNVRYHLQGLRGHP